MKKAKMILAMFLAVVMIAASSTGNWYAYADDPESADYMDNTISFAFLASIDSMCPLASAAAGGAYICDAIYERLVFVKDDYTLEPRAAESWDYNEDATVYTFHLSDDIFWSDGTPVTAKDWVFTAQMATNPDVASPRKSVFSIFEGTDNVGNETGSGTVSWAAVDDYTLKMTLKETTDPTTLLININTAAVPMPAHILSDVSPAELLENEYWLTPVCCGPMIYESMILGQELVLATNQEYYRGAPKFGKMVFKIVAQDAMAAAFMASEIDLAPFNLPLADAKAAAESEVVDACFTENSIATCLAGFNMETLPDVRVRQAIRYCIDLNAISQVMYEGSSQISAYPTVTVGDYYDDSFEWAGEYNPEKAKELLDEAGWDYNRVLIWGAPTGTRATAATIIQQSLQSIGMKVEIRTGDAASSLAASRAGEYDVGMSSVTAWTNDPSTMKSHLYLYAYGLDEELGLLLDTVAGKLDMEERIEAAEAFYEAYFDLCPMANVYKTKMHMLKSSRLQDYDYESAVVGYNVNYQDFIIAD